jgi:aminoglycoside phosphotransferase (APT) family kinase protein
MLDRARAATYEVGADLRGATVGEAWPLALPFDIGEALCVGRVDANVLATLNGFASRCTSVTIDEVLRAGHGCADLVCLGTAELARLPELASGVSRLLAPEGLIAVPAARVEALTAAGLHVRQRLWCAPSATMPVAIVPALDAATIEHFTSRGLHDPSTIVPLQGTDRYKTIGGHEIALLGVSPRPVGSSPPAWLTELAAQAGVDVAGHRWGIWARRQYSSQKVIILLFGPTDPEPEIVVKIARDPRFDGRIAQDYEAITLVHGLPGHDRHVPRPLFAGEHRGRVVAAVEAVRGLPFPQVAAERDGAFARSVVRWLGELAAQTARPADPVELVEPLGDVVERVNELFPLTGRESTLLRRHVDALATSTDPLPVVVQHGNVADWNLIVRPNGDVVFLDWEFAEPDGLPLWDLFFFMRFQDWPLVTGWRRALYGNRRSRRDLFLHRPGSSPMRAAIATYRTYVDVPLPAIESLFHLCWAHQCLNAATHETPTGLATTPMFRLLRRGLAMGETGELQAFLGSG